ncbi:unnamed protein product [Owenia fusiformis]|uniref:Uncharacterized protein n=1 Tax=Owenia fusiformis TaxID=6347 RepID=A0A8J1XT37_OWEFU|nr:unnamed protein product [Owenia fusiformis]
MKNSMDTPQRERKVINGDDKQNDDGHAIPKFYFEDTSKESSPEIVIVNSDDDLHPKQGQSCSLDDNIAGYDGHSCHENMDNHHSYGQDPDLINNTQTSHCYTRNGSVKLIRHDTPDFSFRRRPGFNKENELGLPRSGSLTDVNGQNQGLAPNSGPPSRSSSCRRRKSRVVELQEEAGLNLNRPQSVGDIATLFPNKQHKPVTHSNSDSDLYRVRSFKITKKGQLINQGDSWKSWSKESINSTCSLESQYGDTAQILWGLEGYGTRPSQEKHKTGESETPILDEGIKEPSVYKVLVMGNDGVGKSALMQQFTTSEDMSYMEPSEDVSDEITEAKQVSVLLDGEESILLFYELNDEGVPQESDADGYVVVYSITDRLSFYNAIDIIHKLRDDEQRDSAMIVVGNKSDIVRQRQVPIDEGKSIAKTYKSKFIETSTYLNHHVDVLLVGVLSQIRKHSIKIKKAMEAHNNPKHSLKSAGPAKPKKASVLRKLFGKSRMFKSVDNVLK